ncbi:hypothetical protein ABH922_004972 [Rhodococcus sp. 27YEA15]
MPQYSARAPAKLGSAVFEIETARPSTSLGELACGQPSVSGMPFVRSVGHDRISPRPQHRRRSRRTGTHTAGRMHAACAPSQTNFCRIIDGIGLHRDRSRCRHVNMLGLIGFLLIIWLIFVVLGFVVKGLLWLAIIGIILFVATAAWGWIKRQANT